MVGELTCAKSPCISCPYRRDVPSGVWSAEEYEKLPAYDGSIAEQLMNGAMAAFFCHQNNGKLCAGWLGTHKTRNLLALRMRNITNDVANYESPVPVFSTGKEACAHGKRQIKRPSKEARAMVAQIQEKRPELKAPDPLATIRRTS